MKKLIETGLLALTLLTGCATTKDIVVEMNQPSLSGASEAEISLVNFRSNSRSISGDSVAREVARKLNSNSYTSVNDNAPAKLHANVYVGKMKIDTWSEKHEGKDKTWYSYHAKASKSIEFDYILKKGSKTLASGTDGITLVDEEKSNDNYTDAKSKLASEAMLNKDLKDRVATSIIEQIAPHKALVKMVFKKGDDTVNLANKYIDMGRYKQALNLLRQAADKSSDKATKVAAIHNMGKVYLILGQHTKGYEMVRSANMMDPSDMDVLDSLSFIETLKGKHDAFNEQRENQQLGL